LKSGKWKPREAHKIADSEVTLKESLLLSYNRPVIRISDEIGFEKIEEEFLKFVPKLKKPLSEYPSQLLGAVELSVKELWSAYSQFIEKECLSINDSNKKWEDTILYQMSDPETTTVRRLVGKQMGMQRFFGKTGTSNNGLDNWYVFFDGKYLGVIWVGLEGGRSGESLGLYGGTTSFRLYNSFMRNRGKRFSELSCDNLHKKSSE
jgi:penicillin-binding protein 1B